MLAGKNNLTLTNFCRRLTRPGYVMFVAVAGAAFMFLVLYASRCSNHSALIATRENLDSMIMQQLLLHKRLELAARKLGNVLQAAKQVPSLPTIYAITPTYKRFTQKADLTRVSQTFMHIPNFHWIVVEDAGETSETVRNLLKKKKLRFTHLAVKTQTRLVKKENDPHWRKHRGVDQRNLGLKWVRENVKDHNGVVYFADDDNTYDIDLFEEMRFTKTVSVWPVALVGGLRWEGPVCVYGKVISFFTAWQPDREFPLDMGAFAVNLDIILHQSSAYIDPESRLGYLETDFLNSLGIRKEDMEPKGNNCRKILVWHTQTVEPKMKQERRLKALGMASDPNIEI